MSSNPKTWRDVLAYLDRNPRVESVLEVAFTTVVTFVPMLIASLLSMSRDKTFVWMKFKANFFSYFTSGELIMVVLATCASVVWIYIFKAKDANIFMRFVVAVTIFVVTLIYAGGILGNNPGFEDVYPSWVLWTIFVSYIISIIFWIKASIYSKVVESLPSDNEAAKADRLVREARKGEEA